MDGGGLSQARLEAHARGDGRPRRARRACPASSRWSAGAARCTSTRSARWRSTSGDPMRRDTIFRIASMTKPITAAAAMILVEECRLRLDDPVDELLPELADRQVLRSIDSPLDDTVPANRPITLRDLLTFRLGFGAIIAPPGPVPDPAGDERARALPPGRTCRRMPPDEWMASRQSAADAPAGRAVALQHRLRHAGRADRPRHGQDARGVPARAHLRAARHEGHRLQRAGRASSTGWRAATGPTSTTGESRSSISAEDSRLRQPARVRVGRRRAGLDRRRLSRLRRR